MVGTAPGIFEPDKPITRAEAAAIAVRLYKATNEDFVEVIHQVLPSVVQVENFELGGLGSGTIIHPAGYVLTNHHVVSRTTQEEGQNPVTTVAKTVGFRTTELPWRYAEGPVIAWDADRDLALCKIELSDAFPALPFGDFSKVTQAQKVMAIGSPLGLIQSVSEGVVSGFRTFGGRGPYIQTEAEINPGNSGGALVNLAGELIGVPSMKLVGTGIEGLGFAIGLPMVLDFIREKEPGILEEIGGAQ
jgi:S1-C subfamily serine protease